MDATLKILDPIDEDHLRQTNQVTDVGLTKIAMKKRRFQDRSSSSEDTPSSPQHTEMITIPVILDSIDTLEFLGFTVKAAEELYGKWNVLPKEAKELFGLLTFVHDHLDESEIDAYNEDDDWKGVFASLGMATDFIDALTEAPISCSQVL